MNSTTNTTQSLPQPINDSMNGVETSVPSSPSNGGQQATQVSLGQSCQTMAKAAGGFIGRVVDTVDGGVKKFFALPAASFYLLTLALAVLACCCHAFMFTSILIWPLLDLFEVSVLACMLFEILRIVPKMLSSGENSGE